jgi:hypothetical protein
MVILRKGVLDIRSTFSEFVYCCERQTKVDCDAQRNDARH